MSCARWRLFSLILFFLSDHVAPEEISQAYQHVEELLLRLRELDALHRREPGAHVGQLEKRVINEDDIVRCHIPFLENALHGFGLPAPVNLEREDALPGQRRVSRSKGVVDQVRVVLARHTDQHPCGAQRSKKLLIQRVAVAVPRQIPRDSLGPILAEKALPHRVVEV